MFCDGCVSWSSGEANTVHGWKLFVYMAAGWSGCQREDCGFDAAQVISLEDLFMIDILMLWFLWLQCASSVASKKSYMKIIRRI